MICKVRKIRFRYKNKKMLFLENDKKRKGKCSLCFYCDLSQLCCARKNCKEAKKARVPRLTFSKVFKRLLLKDLLPI
jgi:hypothetical protein